MKLGAVKRLLWTDTRDITADPNIKGAASRKPMQDICRGMLWQRHASAELVLYGPGRGLHHLHPSGRRLTDGEIAQSGRGVTASANEGGDGPAAVFMRASPARTDCPDAASEVYTCHLVTKRGAALRLFCAGRTRVSAGLHDYHPVPDMPQACMAHSARHLMYHHGGNEAEHKYCHDNGNRAAGFRQPQAERRLTDGEPLSVRSRRQSLM